MLSVTGTNDSQRPLWTCLKCGAKFVGRNTWHACGPYTVEKFLEGKGPNARALFARFVELIAQCGPYEAAPAKTRVAFMVRVRFAGLSSLSERGMTCAFGLPYPLEHPRIRKIEQSVRNWYGHYLRITSLEQLDDELLAWLRASYHLMGEQQRFDTPVAPTAAPFSP